MVSPSWLLVSRKARVLTQTSAATGYAVFMFMLAMWIMLRDRKHRQVNYALVGAGCSLMVLATAVRGRVSSHVVASP